MSDSTRRWDLVVDARQSELGEVADFIEGVCQSLGLEDDAAFAVQLATDEACQNVAEHACRYAPEQEIKVTCQLRGPDLEITIRDRGEPFDPASVPSPKLDGTLAERNGGGLGIHFMRHMMDEVRFERTPDGTNALTMVKKGILTEDEPEPTPS